VQPAIKFASKPLRTTAFTHSTACMVLPIATCRQSNPTPTCIYSLYKTKKKEKSTTGYLPRPLMLSDQNQTLHVGWPAVCSYTCQVWSKSVKGLRRCGGRKWPFHITLASGLYIAWPWYGEETSQTASQTLLDLMSHREISWRQKSLDMAHGNRKHSRNDKWGHWLI